MNRSIILPALVTAFVALSPAGVALADNPHLDSDGNRVATGQPNKEESDLANLKPPGHSSDGFVNVASQHYAGQPGTPTDPSDPHTPRQRPRREPIRRRRLPVVHPPWGNKLLRRAYALTRPGQSRCVPRSAPRPAGSA